MLLPQMLFDFIRTTISSALTLGTSGDRAEMASSVDTMKGSLVAVPISDARKRH